MALNRLSKARIHSDSHRTSILHSTKASYHRYKYQRHHINQTIFILTTLPTTSTVDLMDRHASLP
ncbi:hypothetical protein BCR42DRAFT_158805 [Absidia repens]|uniref:Uncharacterized protein n=1 Tax=Absidia repens TaxID=90262 RepID=A0A1X2I0G8_9FUNG|nr:hypothetical protein BCR42DRAFT_158805 [Absidia repens]